MTWNDRFVSVIRTGVPALVGTVITWLIGRIPAVGVALSWLSDALGVDVRQGLGLLAAAAAAAGYYALVRWLGQRWPQLEVLLGSTKTPTAYVKPTQQTTPPVPDVDTAGGRAPTPTVTFHRFGADGVAIGDHDFTGSDDSVSVSPRE